MVATVPKLAGRTSTTSPECLFTSWVMAVAREMPVSNTASPNLRTAILGKHESNS